MTSVDVPRPGSPAPDPRVGAREATTRDLVLGAAALLVVAQLAFRAWALYPSWFYTDDYRLLSDATGSDLDWAYLSRPFDSQFMPFGRAVAWVVANSGHVNWTLAATITLVVQLAASAACVWMLTTLFGVRWAILPPLALYLTSAIGLPAVMWWAASLNQLPLQVVLFVSVGSWVRYLRGRRPRWLALTLLVVGLGLLAYVKVVLVLGVLAYLVLAHFATGGPRARLLGAVRTYWPAALGTACVAAAFAGYYVLHVPSVFQPGARAVAGGLFDTMVGTAFASGVVGGPWRWDTSNPPVGYADPPDLMAHLAWVVIALAVLGLALLRVRTLRAWVLLAGYLGAAYLLLLTSRAPVAGGSIGREYRYLTDVLPVLSLSLALATMRLRGAPESSARREAPVLVVRPRAWLLGAALALLVVSSTASSASYARIWHDDNPGDRYAHAAIEGLEGKGAVDLADQIVPREVVPGFSTPYNTTGRLLPLLIDNARFPDTTPSLVVLDEDGHPHAALIDETTASTRGPRPGCGWQVGRARTRIPLESTPFDYGWWVRIGYLASTDDRMVVRVAGTTHQVDVSRGLHSVFVRVQGGPRSVTVGGLRAGSTVCVDTVEVGVPVPGAPL